jgi:predicted CopG family antitoxin
MNTRIHMKQISVSLKLYDELVELASKKGDTVNQVVNDLITAGLKKKAE